MDSVSKLADFIQQLVADERLKPVHLSVSLALCDAWIMNHFNKSYSISRRTIMRSSRIRSKATYHKVIRDLTSFGYIRYQPTYHPGKGSTVTIVTGP